MLLVAAFAFGKGVSGHSDDMWTIFPFDYSMHDAENYNIQEFYKDVSAFIDYCEYPALIKDGDTKRRECSRMQELFKDSKYKDIDANCKWDNHRIWFHWGFYNTSRDSKELQQRISRTNCKTAMKVANVDVRKDIDALFEKRKKHLMKQWDITFSTPKCQSISREKKEAFVSLLYSIHILGDYTKKQLAELQPIYDLYKNIRKDILTIGDNSAVATNFLYQIGLKRTDSNDNPSVTELLNNLSKDFTPFLYELEKEGKGYITAFGEKYKLKKAA